MGNVDGGQATCYSFNSMCSPVPEGIKEGIIMMDKFGSVKKVISLKEHSKNVDTLKALMEVYFEFPAVYDGCALRTTDLLQHRSQLKELQLPSMSVNGYHREYRTS